MTTLALPYLGFPKLDWSRVSAWSGTVSVHLLALLLALMPLAPQVSEKLAKPDIPINVQIIEPQPLQPLLLAPPAPTPPTRRARIRAITPTTPLSTQPATIAQSEEPESKTHESESPQTGANESADIAPSALSYAGATRVNYPVESKRYREQGTVLLRVLIDEAGIPRRIEVEKSSGYARLDRAARESVMQWRFNPGTRDGKPQSAWGLVPVAFRLENI